MKARRLPFVVFVIVFTQVISVLNAAVIRVPADYPAIQEALDNSQEHDTIVINAGTYYENLVFPGHDLILKGVGDEVVVNGGFKSSVIMLSGNETEKTLISGLTIIFGGEVDFGAGINANYSSATIRNCAIKGNRSDFGGGAIAFSEGLIEDCTFHSNQARYLGGALYECLGPVIGNYFYFNRLSSSGRSLAKSTTNLGIVDYGGAMYDCDGYIGQNIFGLNSSTSSDDGAGGALAFCDGVIDGNIFDGNLASRSGSAIFSCNAAIENNYIVNSSLRFNGSAVSNSGLVFRNNEIAFNRTAAAAGILAEKVEGNLVYSNEGGGMGGSASVRIWQNNTIFGNGNSGLYPSSTSVVQNCIILENAGGSFSFNVPAVIENSLIAEDGITGEMIFTDPAAFDFSLLPYSIAIDGGTTTTLTEDLLGNFRPIKTLHWSDARGDGSGMDIGAIEFNKEIKDQDAVIYTLLDLWELDGSSIHDANVDEILDAADL